MEKKFYGPIILSMAELFNLNFHIIDSQSTQFLFS
jgi:hypothetical protein